MWAESHLREVTSMQQREPTERPPGPRGLPWLGKALSYARDPVAFAGSMINGHKPIGHIRSCGWSFYFLSTPDAVEEGFIGKARKSIKAPFLRGIDEVLGAGLLVAEGDAWRKQRKLVQHAFMPEQVLSWLPVMSRRCDVVLEGWDVTAPIAIDQAMMSLTLDIMSHSILGADLRLAHGSIKDAVDEIAKFFEFVVTPHGFLLRKFPTPARSRFLRSARVLDELIYRLIEASLTAAEPQPSLLTRLAHAWRDADGDFERKLLRDDLLTIFLAGHETTALTLTYALNLLAQHPEIQVRAAAETAGVDVVDYALFSDAAKLPLVRAIIRETLRLYPPAWIFAREITGDDTLLGYSLPKGSVIVTSPWWIHRQQEVFPEPDSFKPDRWSGGLVERLSPGTYLPFGIGPRRCVGQLFAEAELVVALVGLLKRFGFQKTTDALPRLQPAITIRPRHPVLLRVVQNDGLNRI